MPCLHGSVAFIPARIITFLAARYRLSITCPVECQIFIHKLAFRPNLFSQIFYNIQRQVRKYPQEKDCEVISDREAASRVKFGVQKEAMDLIRRALLLYNQVEEDFSKMKFDKKGNLVENHPYRIRKFTGRKQNEG